jgi:hypothetical protein
MGAHIVANRSDGIDAGMHTLVFVTTTMGFFPPIQRPAATATACSSLAGHIGDSRLTGLNAQVQRRAAPNLAQSQNSRYRCAAKRRHNAMQEY